jgi:hypothetical protein
LIVVAVGGKQLHHAVGAVRGHVTDRSRGEVDGVTNLKLMLFQRSSPGLELPTLTRTL